MEVTFHKWTERRLSHWHAVRGKRTRILGATMALGRGDMPHDLVQLVVEATAGVGHGVWGCVADGATFRSMGRKRTTAGPPTGTGQRRTDAHGRDLDVASGRGQLHSAVVLSDTQSGIGLSLIVVDGGWSNLPAA